MLTGHFAEKPTRGQSSHRLLDLQTGTLTDSELVFNHEKTTLYLYTKPKPKPNPNPIDY